MMTKSLIEYIICFTQEGLQVENVYELILVHAFMWATIRDVILVLVKGTPICYSDLLKKVEHI